MMALVPAGGGHQSVARAVSEALLDLDPQVNVSLVNVSAGDNRLHPVNALPQFYATVTIRAPQAWRAVFNATNGRLRYAPAEAALQSFVRPKVREILRADPPDIVVSLNPALGPVFRSALADLGWRRPLGVVVSDLVTLHHAWFCPGATWHAVPTEAARRACLAAGLPPTSVHVTGQPVAKGFCRAVADRAALRRSLGLPAEGHVVLIAGGGEGFGQVEATVDALAASRVPCQPVVIAGRNEGLRRRLLARAGQSGCRVLGYVTNMPDWMHAADLLITKAGPNTVMEAVHCRLPLILTGAIPGQEEANQAYVTSHGLGVVALRPQEIAATVAALLHDEERLAAMRRAAERMSRPEAAQEVAGLILNGC